MPIDINGNSLNSVGARILNDTQIVTSGLLLYLDCGIASSYPGSGTVWYDLSGNGYNFNINASAYNNSGGVKYMDFNGSYGCAKIGTDVPTPSGTEHTYIAWTRVLNSTSNWRTLTRALSTGGDHQVIIQSGGWEIGMYDNTNGTGFNGSGFSQQSLPNYGTTRWVCMHWRFYNSAPYYVLSYNDTPGTTRGSNNSVNSRIKNGICSIGAYNNGNQSDVNAASQFWGDIAVFQVYNRALSNAEILQNYLAHRGRFGL